VKGDFLKKIFSPFNEGRFLIKNLFSLQSREILKGENIFSLGKGSFEGRISLQILPSGEGRI